MRGIIILFVVFGLASGCVTYKDVVFQGVEQLNITKISPDGIVADVELKITNPNNYKITVDTKQLDLYVNTQKIGKTKLKNKLILNKNTTEVYKVKVVTNLPEDGQINLGTFLFGGGGGLNIQFKGQIVGKAKGISKTIDVDFSKRVPIM